jgi:hypothetical protein
MLLDLALILGLLAQTWERQTFLEAFYIAGQTSSSTGLSSEKSRILIQFDMKRN